MSDRDIIAELRESFRRPPTYDPVQAACAVTLPGIDHLAPILLMRDGRYEVARDLTGPEQHACRAWIADAGDQFRRHNTDLLDQEKP